MIRKSAFFLAFTLLTILSFSQKNCTDTLIHKINESAIHGSLGLAPIFLNFHGNYEIMLAEHPDKTFKKRGLRVSAGIFQLWEDYGWSCTLKYTCFTGLENNHFELGVGATYWHYLSTSGKYPLPAGNLGYRYQKPDGRFVFRTGLGFPEGLFVSFGYCIKQTPD